MLFNEPAFLFAFLPVAWGGFRLVSMLSQQAALLWLVAASCVFYGWWNPDYVPLLIVSIAANYLAGEVIRKSRARPDRLRLALIGAVTANIALLVYYKYLAALAGFAIMHGIPLPAISPLTLPLGISFFTFTQIAYLADVAAGIEEDRDPLAYAVFVTFFPHLIAGPILHHGEMMPQFRQRGRVRFVPEDLIVGIAIFVIGLAKKSLIADPTALAVGPAFDHAGQVQFFAAWQGALSYSLQLYFDFSGYSDMAIGLSRMFGIRFPLNFASPYKAQSVIEYWQRWHMTLTRYLTQYVFNPLSIIVMRRLNAIRRSQGVRVSRTDRFIALIAIPLPITMILAGIWHGAGLQFLVFGLLHGIYLTINHLWRNFGPKPGPDPGVAHRSLSIAVTYLSVLIGSVFFRAQDVSAGMGMLSAMFGMHGIEMMPGNSWLTGLHAVARPLSWLLMLYLIVWRMPNTQEIMGDFQPALGYVDDRPGISPRFRPTLLWAMSIGVIATVAMLMRQQSEFLYFRF